MRISREIKINVDKQFLKKVDISRCCKYLMGSALKKKKKTPKKKYNGRLKCKVTLFTKLVQKRGSLETTFIRFLTKFPRFLHSHPAHQGTYYNAKLIYGCHRYTTSVMFNEELDDCTLQVLFRCKVSSA